MSSKTVRIQRDPLDQTELFTYVSTVGSFIHLMNTLQSGSLLHRAEPSAVDSGR